MEIEADALGIPDTEYQAVIKMPAAVFQRICRDLTILGDTGSFFLLFTYNILTPPILSHYLCHKEGSQIRCIW